MDKAIEILKQKRKNIIQEMQETQDDTVELENRIDALVSRSLQLKQDLNDIEVVLAMVAERIMQYECLFQDQEVDLS